MPVVLHLFMSTWTARDLFNSTYRKHAHRITSFAKDATSWSWACIFEPWKLDAWWHFKLGITLCENIGISLHYVSPMLWRHTCQAYMFLQPLGHVIHWIISCLPSIWQGISHRNVLVELIQFTTCLSSCRDTWRTNNKRCNTCHVCKSRCQLFSGRRHGSRVFPSQFGKELRYSPQVLGKNRKTCNNIQ